MSQKLNSAWNWHWTAESYADYVDAGFDSSSAVYSLQAHMKKKHSNNNYYLLDETAIANEMRVPVIGNVVTAVNNIDPDADPHSNVSGETHLRKPTTLGSEFTKTRYRTG